MESGTHKASRIGNPNFSGITPITVCGTPLARMVLPTMSGELP
jgi:hypothetical protein